MKIPKWGRSLLQLAAMVVVLTAARASIADHYRVPTGSMEPTIQPGDHLVVNKAAYGARVPMTHTYVGHYATPHVGDVVILDSPEEDKVLVKRVVGVPGATVAVTAGHVTIDGVEQPIANGHETLGGVDHEISLDAGGGPDFGPMLIPDGQYLVMGDNRGDSRDGRYFGLVPVDTILGKAEAVVWRGGPTWDGL